MGPIDPAFFEDGDVRAALAARDSGALYRLLRRVGLSQRRIAHLTGQSQSEVSEILKGRQVLNVRVLERIADGLDIPRTRMGVSYGEETPPANKEVNEDTKRRILIAATIAAALNQGTQALGGPIELALPTGQELPSRLDMYHVYTVRAVTERLRGVARYYGGQGDLFGGAAMLYTPWMQVPATDAVKAQLAAALAELHTEAAWYCYDSGVDGRRHFTRALRLADKAGDTYGVANAACNAGTTLAFSGHPNDALKLFQLGQFRLPRPRPGKSTPATPRGADDRRIPTLTAKLARYSATAYAVMKDHDKANHYLTEAHDGWEPPDAFEHGEADLTTAFIQLELGQFDAAEQSAASAVRSYGEGHRMARTMADLLRAEIHIRSGEPQGLTLAHHAINGVSTLQSVATRRERLIPLAAALEVRPGTDTQELARTARQIATTRI